MAVTVTLEDEIDVSRGDMLVHPNNVPRVDRALRGDAGVDGRGADGARPAVPGQAGDQPGDRRGQPRCTTASTSTRCAARTPPAWPMNEVGRCTVTLEPAGGVRPYRQQPHDGRVHPDRSADQPHRRRRHDPRSADRRTTSRRAPGTATRAKPRARPRRRQVTSGRAGGALRPARRSRSSSPASTGAGKSTLAYALERRLFDAGPRRRRLDGRQMRQTISRDLGFTAAERSENLRRAADVARLLNEAGLIASARCSRRTPRSGPGRGRRSAPSASC